MIIQKSALTANNKKQTISKNNFKIFKALKRNKFFTLKSRNNTNNIQCQQQNNYSLKVKNYLSIDFNKDFSQKQKFKSLYQQCRQRKKYNLKDKWNGTIFSQRKEKSQISPININKNINVNRSLVIHSRNNTRRNNQTLQSFIKPQYIQLDFKTNSFPQKYQHLFQLIRQLGFNQRSKLVSFSKQKAISQRTVEKRIKSQQKERINRFNKKYQNFNQFNIQKTYRPWSRTKKQFQLQDLATTSFDL